MKRISSEPRFAATWIWIPVAVASTVGSGCDRKVAEDQGQEQSAAHQPAPGEQAAQGDRAAEADPAAGTRSGAQSRVRHAVASPCDAVTAGELQKLLHLDGEPHAHAEQSAEGSTCRFSWGGQGDEKHSVVIGYLSTEGGNGDVVGDEKDRMSREDGFEPAAVPPLQAAYWQEGKKRLYGFPSGDRALFVDLSHSGFDDALPTAKALMHAAVT